MKSKDNNRTVKEDHPYVHKNESITKGHEVDTLANLVAEL